MKPRRALPSLFWISPGDGLGEALWRQLRACVRGGLQGFQLREKASFARDLAAAGTDIRKILPAGDGLALVNDRVDVAQAAPFDGVHLGGGSLPVAKARAILGEDAWIGRSVHDQAELEEAAQGGADFVFASPVFPVRKSGLPASSPLGLVGLERLIARSPLPVLALGGITLDNVSEVRRAGVHGVAVMRSVANAGDPRAFVEAMLEQLA